MSEADTLAPHVSAEEAAAAAAFDAEIDGASQETVRERPAEKAEPKPEPVAEATEEAPERDYEAEAREMGWKPVDDWNGDPEKHRDAKTFVELADNDPAVLRKKYDAKVKETEDFKARISAATKAEIARAEASAKARYEADMAALQAERDELFEQYAGDPNAIKQINQNFEKATSQVENPEAVIAGVTVKTEWEARRPQYQTDPVFNAAAMAEMNKIIAEETEDDWRGKTALQQQQDRFRKMDERLAATGRFADIYGNDKPAKADLPKGAPPADSRSMDSSRTSPAKAKSGWDTLPADAKGIWKVLQDDGVKITKEQFAKDYHND